MTATIEQKDEWEIGLDGLDQSGSAGDFPADLSFLDGGWGDWASDLPADEAASGLSDEPDFYPDGAWSAGDLFPVDGVGDQERDLSPQSLLEAPADAALNAFPDTQGQRTTRRKKAQARLNKVTWEDWDSPTEQKLVRLLHLRISTILQGDEPKKAAAFLDWIFRGRDPGESLPFDEIVETLGGDPDEARLRLQSYLYRQWMVVPKPITGVFVSPPPSSLVGKCVYQCGFGADDVARRVWSQPGVPFDHVMSDLKGSNPMVGDDEWQRIIERMLETRLMLEHASNLYLVGHYGYLLERKDD